MLEHILSLPDSIVPSEMKEGLVQEELEYVPQELRPYSRRGDLDAHPRPLPGCGFST